MQKRVKCSIFFIKNLCDLGGYRPLFPILKGSCITLMLRSLNRRRIFYVTPPRNDRGYMDFQSIALTISAIESLYFIFSAKI